jgi:hypothetical protein
MGTTKSLTAMPSMCRVPIVHWPDIYGHRWRDIYRRRRRVIDGRWRGDVHRLWSERAAYNSSDAKSEEPGPYG